MKINYICMGFDKDFYNFDAYVIPVQQLEEGITKPYNIDILKWSGDINKKLKQLTDFEFKFGKSEAVYSEVTGVYYIFVCTKYWKSSKLNQKSYEEWLKNRYRICIESLFECVRKLNVQRILIQPLLFGYYDIKDQDEVYRLLEKLYLQNTGLSNRKIYAIVNNGKIFCQRYYKPSEFIRRNTDMQKFKQEYINTQMEKSLSYSNSLIRNAEIETVYNKKSVIEQFREDMSNSSWFFDEYIQKYPGTASKLAERAGIDPSTISTIKSHKYQMKSRNVIIALAIALDLTVEDRKRFINSAGFSYPITEHDHFIEQQLKKKRYNSVIAFNKDIMDEHPNFVIKMRSSNGYNKSDK